MPETWVVDGLDNMFVDTSDNSGVFDSQLGVTVKNGIDVVGMFE